MKKQLVQSEKMATLGTMLAGISHELRNPLTIINARAQRLLVHREGLQEKQVQQIQSVAEQSARCGKIVNDLLNFSHRSSQGFAYTDLNTLLDKAVQLMEYDRQLEGIAVKRQFAPVCQCRCDANQITQAFLNIISNAADALNGSGNITLLTEDNPKSIRVVIEDDGPGIEEKNLLKIFDPFFTTKEPGKGTGLGLALVYRIVENHKGRVTVESRPGRTRFTITLPKEEVLP
jgi:two-component system, NtrC family, sensor kinase